MNEKSPFFPECDSSKSKLKQKEFADNKKKS